MSKFPFEDCAVAFLDILGFLNMIKQAENDNKISLLLNIKTILDNHTQYNNNQLS